MQSNPVTILETTTKLNQQADDLAKLIEELLEVVPVGRKRTAIMRALMCAQDVASFLQHSRLL